MENPLFELRKIGQGVWLSFLHRGLLMSGELQQLINEDGISGVAANPLIFRETIINKDVYNGAIRALSRQGHQADEILRELQVEDAQWAADLFQPLYDKSERREGFVSLGVPLHLAYDTPSIITEARHLWEAVSRPNMMIEVPATTAGLTAMRTLIGEGININATLLFGLSRYRQVTDAYLAGLEERVQAGQPIDAIASVASFSLSRLDVLVDPMLEEMIQVGGEKAETARRLQSHVAVATAKVVYQMRQKIFSSDRFQKLAGRDAQPQRLLWASAGTQNPAYSDKKYVEALIGPDTINCIPLDTLNSYREEGDPAPRLEENTDEARQVLRRLLNVGINVRTITQQLEMEGLHKFVTPFNGALSRKLADKLLALSEKTAERNE